MRAEAGETRSWGTWEELLLGGAVLRHGTRNWDIVVAELRARTPFPFAFNPEGCKAKFEELQQRYSGCKAWFEELRKKRIAELKHALEKSEDSVRFLESKLRNLKDEKKNDNLADNDSSRTESSLPYQKLEQVEPSSHEASKDGLSAGSFTQEREVDWSPECQASAPSSSAGERETNPSPESLEQENNANVENFMDIMGLLHGVNVRKRRGKRKRKECNANFKEGSIGENNRLSSAEIATDSLWKESSTSNCGQIPGSSSVDDHRKSLVKDGANILTEIFDYVLENKCSSLFRHRLDSQKRGRYKKMIRQHVDLDTIKTRIASGFIASAKDLFRDLLLLSNNALVFYSKNTREYKSAHLLRDIVIKKLQQHGRGHSVKEPASNLFTGPPLCSRAVKPRSARPGNCRVSGKLPSSGNVIAKALPAGKDSTNSGSNAVEPVAVVKRSSGRPRKGGIQSGRRPGSAAKGRRRSQRR